MKTLYVSDLDGTLLRSEQKTSDFTNETINQLVKDGMLFSYATARSYLASAPVTSGLDVQIPLITYNGVMVVDNSDGSILLEHYLPDEIHDLLDEMIEKNVYPIVISMQDGRERMTYIPSKSSKETMKFINSRPGDIRFNPVETVEELHSGKIFYFMCMDQEENLLPFYEKYKDTYQCIYQIDMYHKDPWLDVLPKGTSKANAIKQVAEYYKCDKVVAFGDGMNDIEMFELADEAYAVANAVPELKAIATGVIGSNDEDSVAKWLKENYKKDSSYCG